MEGTQLGAFHLVRLEGLEPPTFWFVAKHSIQLSYRRIILNFNYPIRLDRVFKHIYIRKLNARLASQTTGAHISYSILITYAHLSRVFAAKQFLYSQTKRLLSQLSYRIRISKPQHNSNTNVLKHKTI